MNIPTEELRGFVAEEERSPKKMLHPRDLSLDPQLVWKGKDQQDARDLAGEIVPIYIQERIHPHAIVEDLRTQAAAGRVESQPSLFADFKGIPFEQQVEFYQHEQNWANRLILGDSLLVMASLAEKEGLKGQVQMIYLDPPYGIKFASNWQVSSATIELPGWRTPSQRSGRISGLPSTCTSPGTTWCGFTVRCGSPLRWKRGSRMGGTIPQLLGA